MLFLLLILLFILPSSYSQFWQNQPGMMPGSFANDRFLGVNPMFGNQFSSRFPYGGGGGRGFPMAPTPYGPAMGMGPSYGPIAGPGGFNGAWQGALRGAMMGGMSGFMGR